MTFLVPYDQSELSQRALDRAVEFSAPEEEVIALAIIPVDNAKYARERDWIEPTESFDLDRIVSRLEGTISMSHPEVTFDYRPVYRYAQPGKIASEIRRYAKDVDARLVAIGSDNAGRIVTSITSVGSTVATDTAYDVLIVQQGGVTL